MSEVKRSLAPYSVAALVLGICSIVLSCLCVGLVCGIIGIVLSKRGYSAYNAEPSNYSIGMVKAGKITSIVGVVLSSIYIVYWIVWGVILGTSGIF